MSGLASTCLEATFVTLKITFLLLAWGALASFVAWNVLSVVAEVTWCYEDSPSCLFEQFRLLLDVPYYIMPDYSMFEGWDSLNLILYYLAALATAFCFAVAMMIPRGAMWGAIAHVTERIWQPVARVLNVQMPLRKLWLWWCEGLTLAEATLWSLWVAVHGITLWSLANEYDKKFDGFMEMGMRTHVPHSVLICYNLSLAFSWVLYIDFALLFFPISHNSFLNRMLGLPYSALIRFHRWLGHFALWTTAGHGLFFYFYWIGDPTINFWDAFFDWSVMYSIPSFAGTIAFAFGILIWLTSISYVRRNFFNWFYRCHVIGYIGFTVFAMVHYYYTAYTYFPGLFLWAADLTVRSYYAHKRAFITSLRTSSEEGGVVHVDVSVPPKTFRDPMQLLGAHTYLRVPALSRLDYHPFSVCNVAVDEAGTVTLTFVIKSYNNWTQRLRETVLATLESAAAQALPVNIWRPFDYDHHMEWQQYKDILIVAGGIAVTPAAALLRSMISEVRRGALPPRWVHVIFSVRSNEEFAALGSDMLQASQEFEWLQLDLHYTGAGGASTCVIKGQDDTLATAATTDGLLKVPPLAEVKASSSQNSHSSGSHDKVSVTLDKQFSNPVPPPSDSTSTAAGSMFWGFMQGLLPVDFLTDGQQIMVVCLAYFGGFMGFVLSKSATIEYWESKGYPKSGYATIGFVICMIICIQAVGLPAFFVLLPASTMKLVDKMRGKKAFSPGMRMCTMASATINVNGQLSCPESGVSLPVVAGRPALPAIVSEFAAQAHKAGSRAAVLISGPRPMRDVVSLAVSAVNGACIGGGPHLDLHQAAWEL